MKAESALYLKKSFCKKFFYERRFPTLYTSIYLEERAAATTL